MPLDEDIIEESSSVFAGPSTPKSRTVNLSSISECIQRLWPDKTLPTELDAVVEAAPHQRPAPAAKRNCKAKSDC